jgi:hypothetical protein
MQALLQSSKCLSTSHAEASIYSTLPLSTALHFNRMPTIYPFSTYTSNPLPITMALQTPSPTLYVSNLETKTKKPGAQIRLLTSA